MGRQVGWTGLVQIEELPGKDSEEEDRDNERKDIFGGVKENEVKGHSLERTLGNLIIYYRPCNFL